MRAILLPFAAAALFLAGPLAAQDLGSEGRYWEGMDAFLRFFALRGLRFDANEAAWTERDPKEQIVVVLGDTSPLGHLGAFQDQALLRFVDRGGALLFASDLGDEGNLLDGFLVRFGPAPVVAQDPEHQLGEYSDCPVIGASDVSQGHPLFREALPIATNRPAYIRLPRSRREGPSPKLRLAALFPPGTGPEGAAFLLAGDRPEGREWRAIVLSDHSVFINEMLQPELQIKGYGNARFATNVVDWLAQDRRKHVLVLYNGAVMSPVAPAVPSMKRRLPRRLPPGQMLAILNRFLSWIDDARLVEDMVAETSSLGDRSFESLVFVFATVTTPLVLFAIAAAGLRSRRRTGSEAWNEVAADPGSDPLSARIAEAVARRDRSDAIEIVARRFYARTGLPRPAPRPVLVPPGWSRRRVRRALEVLERAAGGRLPRRRDPRTFAEIREGAESLERSLKEGKLTFDDRS